MANSKNNQAPTNPSRRNLLKSAGLVGAAVASSGAATQVIAADSSSSNCPPQPLEREALETLTAAENETLEALVDRILPSDENGPGAREARAAHYIDRSLASDNKEARGGYAIGLTILDEYARSNHGKPFHQLGASDQDAIITSVIDGDVPGFNPSGRGFFGMVRAHTIQGTFSDPYYGGNRNFVGWDMIGYPGVRIAASESDVAQGRALAPNHQSAYDISTFTKDMGKTGGAGNAN
ncbi:MAG: gluconate 2-dehydrogenase subunit 3 family protein [Gammaproteobacteria bacterium]|nr:gluconate 2-dehydrogenase subunit 3 family protein [Gammaproteobacteria bacterium]